MSNIFTQRVLFSHKGDFNSTDFEEKCTDPTFVECVQRGAMDAMSKLESAISNLQPCTMSLRDKSSLLHRLMSECIKNNIDESMNGEDIHCYVDPSGNKRNVIEYGGYTFIFRKNLDSRNDTGNAAMIDEQELDKHVITIHYSTDTFWTRIASLSFMYVQNGSTTYMYSISTSKPEFMTIETLQPNIYAPEVKRDKPVLKTKEKTKKKVLV